MSPNKLDNTITLVQLFTLFFQLFTLLISFINSRITLKNATRTVRFQRSQAIVDLLSRLISTVDPSKNGWENLISQKHVSEEHFLLEQKLFLWLDSDDPIESDLIYHISLLRIDCSTHEKLTLHRENILKIGRKVTSKKLK
jgi:hypothetical protein